MRIRFPAFLLPVLTALVLVTGCDRGDGLSATSETDEPGYREGQQLVRQGRTQEALASYLKVIAKRGDSAAESHLETGLIYLQNIKDPLAAIYHFRKYLELQPNSRQAVYVKGLVETAKREFARTLPAQPLENQTERLDMLDQISRLQRENDQLKAELASLRAGASIPTITTQRATLGEPPPEQGAPQLFTVPKITIGDSPITLASEPVQTVVPPPAQGTGSTLSPGNAKPALPTGSSRTHTVQKGDTLYRLSIKYYGNGSKVDAIYEANRDVMPNRTAPLRIGTELKIP